MINKPLVGVAAIVLAVAAAGWLLLRNNDARLPQIPPATVPAPAQDTADAEPNIEHPLPAPADATAAAPSLPALTDSDPPLLEALSQVAGAPAVQEYLMPEGLIRRLVVTIDNLPRQKVAVDKRPTTAVEGRFVAEGDELHATLDPRNFERYKPLVAVVDGLDMQQLTNVYIRFYPLFQHSYQDLGYPTGYFNDRLVQVIDVLLATPQPPGPLDLVRPNVMYTFADASLETRPAGQKLLLRMGPENAAVIKAKLGELRAAITAAPLKGKP